jgi:hypothetical protein
MTLTQNGSALTGTLAPWSMTVNDVKITDGGTITGTISGSSVSLNFTDTIVISGLGLTLNCTMGSTFSGTLSGSSITGVLNAGTTAMNCGGGGVELGSIFTPPISGAGVFVKQ